jgi:hypothetical protein
LCDSGERYLTSQHNADWVLDRTGHYTKAQKHLVVWMYPGLARLSTCFIGQLKIRPIPDQGLPTTMLRNPFRRQWLVDALGAPAAASVTGFNSPAAPAQ